MKSVTIEELLSWAFVHELPKGGGVEGLANANSAWGMISDYGTRISTGTIGSGGSENYFIEQGEPAEDAATVGNAVANLRRCDVIIPEGWNPLADWPDTDGLADAVVADAVGRYRARPAHHRCEMIVSLIVGTAILGRAPDYGAEPSKVRAVERAGKPAWFIRRAVVDPSSGDAHELEVDGYNARTGRPMKGAYRRHELSVDPTGDILGRLDYQIWVGALRRLEIELRPMLAAHRLSPFERSMTPWLAADLPGIQIVNGAPASARKKSFAHC